MACARLSEPERAPDHAVAAPDDAPALVVNASLAMSTGKQAAQAGHALFAWFLALDPAARRAWYEKGCPFRLEFVPQDFFDRYAATVPEELLIVDAGRTEIDRGDRDRLRHGLIEGKVEPRWSFGRRGLFRCGSP